MLVFRRRAQRDVGLHRVGLALPMLAALLLAAEPAAAQECETDADCGFGFACYSDTLVGGTTVTSTSGGTSGGSGGTGVGGSSSSDVATSDGSSAADGGSWTPVCGDDSCDYTESWEECPDDCERYTYCGGADCETDSDCAAGYQCAPGFGSSTSGGSGVTGGSSSWCGDGICEASEEADCPSDCAKTCQRVYHTCEADEDCPSGYHCDFDQGVSVVTGSSSGGDPVYEYLGVCSLNGSSDGTGGAADAGTSASDSASSGETNVSTVSSATSGGETDGASSASGSGGTGPGNGTGSGHNDGGGPLWPQHPHQGCSVGGAAGAPAGSLLFAFCAALGWAAQRRRRRA